MNKYPWLDETLQAKKGCTKDYKPEWGWWRYQVGGKMFAATCRPGPEHRGYDERELLTRPGKDIKGIVFNLENNYGYRERHDLDFSSKGIEEYLQKLEEAGGGGSL